MKRPSDTLLNIIKLGYTGAYTFFLIFDLKHRFRVLIRNASVKRFLRVPTTHVLSKNNKNEITFFTAENIMCMLQGKVIIIQKEYCP